MTPGVEPDPAPDPVVPEGPIVRPPLHLLLWYCYGGRLPAKYHTWVLHDVTARTWVLRHFGRWLMVIVPVFCLFLFVGPATFSTRIFIDFAICGAIFMFALVNILIDTDRRAVRAGYTFSVPGEIRAARGVDKQRLSNYERRQRIAERQDRRRR